MLLHQHMHVMLSVGHAICCVLPLSWLTPPNTTKDCKTPRRVEPPAAFATAQLYPGMHAHPGPTHASIQELPLGLAVSPLELCLC